jgi:alkylation response protein AidB-like acyl-CoA dehydrogenase
LVFGFHDRGGHPEVVYENVRVPADNLLGEEGGGFAISQARLGPGRIHHCMRSIGVAERALECMIRRSLERTTFGTLVAQKGLIQDWIAEARIEIDMAREYVLRTAHLMVFAWARVQEGETVLLHAAAGGVGLLTLQILKRRFKNVRVIGICSSADKEALLKATGRGVTLSAVRRVTVPEGTGPAYGVPGEWTLLRPEPAGPYTAAIAVPRAVRTGNHEDWEVVENVHPDVNDAVDHG